MALRKKARKSEKHHTPQRQHQHHTHQLQHQKVEIHIGDHHRKKSYRKRRGRGVGGGVSQMQGYASINLPPTYVNYNFPSESNFGSRNQSAPTPNLVPNDKPVNTLNPIPIMNNSELQPAGRPLNDPAGWRESRIKYFDEPKPEPEKMILPASHPFGKPEPNILEPEGKYTPIYENLPNHSTGRDFEKPSTSQFFGFEKTPEPKPLASELNEKIERHQMEMEDIASIPLGLSKFNFVKEAVGSVSPLAGKVLGAASEIIKSKKNKDEERTERSQRRRETQKRYYEENREMISQKNKMRYANKKASKMGGEIKQ